MLKKLCFPFGKELGKIWISTRFLFVNFYDLIKIDCIVKLILLAKI